jgi:hypothetical protein
VSLKEYDQSGPEDASRFLTGPTGTSGKALALNDAALVRSARRESVPLNGFVRYLSFRFVRRG